MPKKTFKPGNHAARGKGRPVGSRNKFPQWLKDLVVLAAELSGFPRITWVQATDKKGKRLFEMRDKLDAAGKPIKDKSGSVKRERSRDENDRPIPIMKKELVFNGDGGAVGYLAYIAQTYPDMYVRLLRYCHRWKLPVDTEADQDHQRSPSEVLRAELARRGLSVEYFLAAVEAGSLRAAEHAGTENKDERSGKKDRHRHRASRWSSSASPAT